MHPKECITTTSESLSYVRIIINQNRSAIIVLNKIDLIKKDDILPIIEKLSKEYKYDNIIPVSALKHENVEELKKLIVNYLPEREFYYDEDTLTDKPEKFSISFRDFSPSLFKPSPFFPMTIIFCDSLSRIISALI